MNAFMIILVVVRSPLIIHFMLTLLKMNLENIEADVTSIVGNVNENSNLENQDDKLENKVVQTTFDFDTVNNCIGA